MKYLLILSLIAFWTCRDKDAEEFKKSCPYELVYSGHYLRIPITISPHQLTYQVGDTISINTIFSDFVEDLGTQQTFQIEGFPFKPVSLLYRFYDGLEWDAGYRVNELLIDSIYKHVRIKQKPESKNGKAWAISGLLLGSAVAIVALIIAFGHLI